jgi:hypothetical protein
VAQKEDQLDNADKEDEAHKDSTIIMDKPLFRHLCHA